MAQLLAAEADKLIGQRIQQKRKELGFSAEKLSEVINLSQQQLSRYERGASKINVTHLIDIAIFLKTPINWFFQDCLPNNENKFNTNEWDQKWDELSELQKQTFMTFLDTVRK